MVCSSNEHHSLKHLERPIARPQRGVGVPAFELSLEELLVMTGKPLVELTLNFDLDEVHGVLLVDLAQGERV